MRKNIPGLISILLLSTLVMGTSLAEIRGKIRGILPFRADFRQRILFGGVEELSESGRVTVKSPDMIKWEYLDPESKVFVVEKDRYLFLDLEFRQLTRGRIENREEGWIWELFFSPEMIKHAEKDSRQPRTLVIRPPGREITITVEVNQGNLPVRVIQEDESGYRRVFEFSGYIGNVSLEEGEFQIDIPGDVEIIELD